MRNRLLDLILFLSLAVSGRCQPVIVTRGHKELKLAGDRLDFLIEGHHLVCVPGRSNRIRISGHDNDIFVERPQVIEARGHDNNITRWAGSVHHGIPGEVCRVPLVGVRPGSGGAELNETAQGPALNEQQRGAQMYQKALEMVVGVSLGTVLTTAGAAIGSLGGPAGVVLASVAKGKIMEGFHDHLERQRILHEPIYG